MTSRLLFASLAVVLIAAGIYGYIRNASPAKSQVKQIQALDTANGDTATAIANLKTYINAHMGAAASFTLTGSYQRAQAATQTAARVAAANARVYAAAQAACSGHTDSITQAKCNQGYLNQHLQPEPNNVPTSAPQLASYQYHLRAPLWTPDLTGALFFGALAALLAALFYRPGRNRRTA